MLIRDDQTEAKTLAAFGAEAAQLLCAGGFSALADRFDYALACQRDPASAIREELASSLAELGASRLADFAPGALPAVSYFRPNDTGPFALVEQRLLTDNGRRVLLELVVITDGADKHLVLEQVSAAD